VLLKNQATIDEYLNFASKLDDPDIKRREDFLKRCIVMKVDLINTLTKAQQLLDNSIMEESDEEDEFEEVDLEEEISTDLPGDAETIDPAPELTGPAPMSVKTLEELKPVFVNYTPVELEQDPTIAPSKFVDSVDEEEIETIRQEFHPPAHLKELYELAPIVEYGQDLDFWGRNNLTFADVSKHGGLEFEHRISRKKEPVPTAPSLKRHKMHYLNELYTWKMLQFKNTNLVGLLC